MFIVGNVVTNLSGSSNVVNTTAAEVEDYSTTIKFFRDSPVVAKFFKDAYGYAVFHNIGKAGFVVGGSYGKGQVYKSGKVTAKSTVLKGSIGSRQKPGM